MSQFSSHVANVRDSMEIPSAVSSSQFLCNAKQPSDTMSGPSALAYTRPWWRYH